MHQLLILLVILSAIISCDSFTEDSIKPENQVTFTQSEFFTLPGSSIIIDLNSIVEQSFATVTISISRDPVRGTLSKVDTMLLKYRPGRAFQGGEDHFDLSVEHEGKILATKTVTVSMKYSKEEFPCALILVEDKIKIRMKSSSLVSSIPILNNDWFCAIDKSAVNISIYSNPLFGKGLVDGESITYLPGPDYRGHDEFIYKLTPTSDGNAAYGIISVTGWTAQTMNLPNSSLTKMVFVDDTTGYVAGKGMYKTIDGGEHWSQIFNPQNIAGSSVNDIHFRDANNGFAVYSSCDGTAFIWECVNGLATTKDGGASWTLTPINYSPDISSVFFTSASTGFISALGWEDTESLILKTEDGGKTWKQLLIGNFDWLVYRYLILKYADSRTGYAYQYSNIFITQDGGESWEPYDFYNDLPDVNYDDILCMDVVDENTLFAGLSVIGSFTHPTSIVRFERGSTPKVVAVIPYKIWHLEFSPSRNVGFAVGIKGTDPPSELNPVNLSLYKSVDKGETWKEEYIEEYMFDPTYVDISTTMSVPSENVVYILYAGNLIKYSNH